MSRRRPTRVEIDRLVASGRHIRGSRSANERRLAERTAASLAQQLKELGVPYADSARHLGLSAGELRRMRDSKDAPATEIARTSSAGFIIRPATAANDNGRATSSDSFEQTSFVNADHALGSASTAIGSVQNALYVGPTRQGVLIALGLAHDRDTSFRLRREEKVIIRELRGREVPDVQEPTLPELQDQAVRRPFVLHLAAHRADGAVLLADPDGHPAWIEDRDVAAALSPQDGGPSLLVLSFCDSVRVAQLLSDRNIAVVSFSGDVDDDTAVQFASYLYSALRLGRSIRSAFEVAQAACRSLGIHPELTPPHSTFHSEGLPPA